MEVIERYTTRLWRLDHNEKVGLESLYPIIWSVLDHSIHNLSTADSIILLIKWFKTRLFCQCSVIIPVVAMLLTDLQKCYANILLHCIIKIGPPAVFCRFALIDEIIEHEMMLSLVFILLKQLLWNIDMRYHMQI